MEFQVHEKKLLWNRVCRLSTNEEATTFLEVHTDHFPVEEGNTVQYHMAQKLSDDILERCAYVMNGQFVSNIDGTVCYSFGGLLFMKPHDDQGAALAKNVVLGLEPAY